MIIKGKKKGDVTFVCNLMPEAKKVSVVGTFNNWDPDAKRMVKSKDGSFRATMTLPPGDHEYKFVVDGIWLDDPDTERRVPNPHGTLNSVVCVS